MRRRPALKALLGVLGAPAPLLAGVTSEQRGGPTPDDPRSIQAAIDALPREGGTVTLPPGVFTLDAGIRLRPSMRLVGAGMHATVLRVAKSGVDALTFRQPRIATAWLEVAHLSVDGGDLAGAGSAVRFANATAIRIERCEFSGFTRTAEPVLEWSWVEDSTVTECCFFNVTSTGVRFVAESNNNRLTNNIFTCGPAGVGVLLDPSTQNTVVMGCDFEGADLGDVGVDCAGTRNTLIIGNYFEQWRSACIAARTGVARNLTIQNNSLHAAAGAAAYVIADSARGGPNEQVLILNNDFMRLGEGGTVAAARGVAAGRTQGLLAWQNRGVRAGVAIVDYNGRQPPASDHLLLHARIALPLARQRVPAAGTAVTPDPDIVGHLIVEVSGGSAVAMRDPPAVAAPGQQLILDLRSIGAAMGRVTWGRAYRMAGAFQSPAAGAGRTITFAWDGAAWMEIGRAAADIPLGS